MRTDYDTPDGFHVGLDGVWDGNPTTQTVDTMKLGPGAQLQSDDSTLEADTANTVSDESVN